MGITEQVHIPCRLKVFASTNQKDLFLSLSASTYASRTVWLRENTQVSRFCRIKEMLQGWEKTNASGPQKEGLGDHKSERDAGSEERATNPGEGATLVHR